MVLELQQGYELVQSLVGTSSEAIRQYAASWWNWLNSTNNNRFNHLSNIEHLLLNLKLVLEQTKQLDWIEKQLQRKDGVKNKGKRKIANHIKQEFVSDDGAKELCFGCGDALIGRSSKNKKKTHDSQIVIVENHKWHSDHFRCCICSKRINGKFILLEKTHQIYCANHEQIKTCFCCHQAVPLSDQTFLMDDENQSAILCEQCKKSSISDLNTLSVLWGIIVDFFQLPSHLKQIQLEFGDQQKMHELHQQQSSHHHPSSPTNNRNSNIDPNHNHDHHSSSPSSSSSLPSDNLPVHLLGVTKVLHITSTYSHHYQFSTISTQSTTVTTKTMVEKVVVLQGLTLLLTSAVLAHELGHVLVHILDIQVPRNEEEGLCELLSFLWLSYVGRFVELLQAPLSTLESTLLNIRSNKNMNQQSPSSINNNNNTNNSMNDKLSNGNDKTHHQNNNNDNNTFDHLLASLVDYHMLLSRIPLKELQSQQRHLLENQDPVYGEGLRLALSSVLIHQWRLIPLVEYLIVNKSFPFRKPEDIVVCEDDNSKESPDDAKNNNSNNNATSNNYQTSSKIPNHYRFLHPNIYNPVAGYLGGKDKSKELAAVRVLDFLLTSKQSLKNTAQVIQRGRSEMDTLYQRLQELWVYIKNPEPDWNGVTVLLGKESRVLYYNQKQTTFDQFLDMIQDRWRDHLNNRIPQIYLGRLPIICDDDISCLPSGATLTLHLSQPLLDA